MKRFLNILVVMIVSAVMASHGAVAQEATPAAGGEADLVAAADWLVAQQQDDGGFPGFSGESDPSMTIDAILALVALQHRGVDSRDAIDRAVGYLGSGDVALVYAQTGQGQAAKLVLGITSTGGDPRDIAGVDALSLLEQDPDPDTGLYGTGVFDHAFVVLGLAASGVEVPERAIEALEATRTPEGGWTFDGMTDEGAGDSNTTALVVEALVAAGMGDSPMVDDAIAYLQTTVDGTTGAVFQVGGSTPADSISTAYVIKALIAVGEDPFSEAWGNLPAAMTGFQNESGAFHFSADDTTDNIFATVQVVPAVAGVALPIVPPSDASAALVVFPLGTVARQAP